MNDLSALCKPCRKSQCYQWGSQMLVCVCFQILCMLCQFNHMTLQIDSHMISHNRDFHISSHNTQHARRTFKQTPDLVIGLKVTAIHHGFSGSIAARPLLIMPSLHPSCAVSYRLACTRRTKIQIYQGDIRGSRVGSSRHCFRDLGDHLPEYGEELQGGGVFDIEDPQGHQKFLQTFVSPSFLSFVWKTGHYHFVCSHTQLKLIFPYRQ